MKSVRSRDNEIDPGVWERFETIPDQILAKQMHEPFSLDGCCYEAGDYLGVAGFTVSPNTPIKYDLFAMPKSMFEQRFRKRMEGKGDV